MNIKDIFFKPLDRSINGVVKADQNDDETVYQELDEYVVTNELEKHFRDFFDSYSTELTDPSIANRVGVWISGFFGSGKSHFLKTLSYILANKEVRDPNGKVFHAVDFFGEDKIRDAMIRADITKAVSHHADVILFNIDSKEDTNATGDPILNVFLRVFNEMQGFSGDHPHIAHMERYLEQKKVYDAFKQAFQESSGLMWEKERDGYQFSQDHVEFALAKVLNMSADNAHKWFEESEKTFSVSVEKFCHWVKEYLDSKDPKQRILFLVDEVGQFIGSDTRLMLRLQTITENLGTICNGRAWIIVTSQADMDAVLGEFSSTKANDFSKIAGRFKTRLSLSSANTDEVIQKRLLYKTDEAKEALSKVFSEKGDVLKNQLSFDRSGPTLRTYEGVDSFVQTYPFVPYHFQLVQKVFEEIRKVGATGAHLAYGERSMLDAFQLAAQSISNEEIGVLVPFHKFYNAVEGFLDTAVKRTIIQAKENDVFEELDIQLLRTLFMIRYVDLIKGTLDNLVTLSISKIDEDKLALRQRVENSLGRLEKESLITRNGDEYIFLTNEERDITRKIKATDISSSEENKALSNLIFKDVLRDQNKYRYLLNSTDYSIGRYLDGHSIDGKNEHDLKITIISPLDGEYKYYDDAMCISRSADQSGCYLLKLEDDKAFFSDLKTFLRTEKYVRLNNDSTSSDISKILSDRSRENIERKKRLLARLDEILLNAQNYILGQIVELTDTTAIARFNAGYDYLLRNTYTKLDYIQHYQKDPWRELKAILTADDIDQLSLIEKNNDGYFKASKEVELYISLKTTGQERVLVSDVVNHFSQKPYGWPDTEIILMIGQIAATGLITFHYGGATLQCKDAVEPLQNSKQRSDISIIKKRQISDDILKKARNLTKDLFSKLGPETEKELFTYYIDELEGWKKDFIEYKNKSDVRQFPGAKVIKDSILLLTRLLANKDSFTFFEEVVSKKDDYLDLADDYHEQSEFFNSQYKAWEELQNALRRFEKNASALEKNDSAKNSLAELRRISAMDAPYSVLNKVMDHIQIITKINDDLVIDRQNEALKAIDHSILELSHEIQTSGIATDDVSNQLLRPLQLLKDKINSETSISTIFMLQTNDVKSTFEEQYSLLDEMVTAEVKRQEALAAQSKKDPASIQVTASTKPVIAPLKPIVNISKVYGQVSKDAYLEDEESIDQFIEALRSQLKKMVREDKRVRIN